MGAHRDIAQLAPSEPRVTDYDRRHYLVYAALLDEADAGRDWQCTAESLLSLDVNAPGAHACWTSHLARARWIASEGYAQILADAR